MGIFNKQLLNVIEWNETRDDIIFWMWKNKEIKKNSKLIIRPGQDAVFLQNGKIEGIFKDEGDYEIESQIIPFLSTLKGFKFGFNSGLRAEVLFVNTKEFMVRWGTKNPINIPAQGMPGGLPIRCFGFYTVKVDDYITLIDKIAGVKGQYTVDDIRTRTSAIMDGLLMKWIAKEGKNMFNLQVNSADIARGLKTDLDMQLIDIGLTVTAVTIENFSYPDNVQKMIDKNAAYGMVGNIGHYQNIAMVEAMEKNPNNATSNIAQAGIGLQMGMEIAKEMKNNISNTQNNNASKNYNNICSNCKIELDENAKFCPSCGEKVVQSKSKFCSECGAKQSPTAKFCSECGNKM